MEELYGDPTSDHAPRSRLEVKMEEVVPKMERRRGSDAEQTGRK